ncbi:MAG: zf-HC2 domain-containing protein [Solirubrobacteraceae bacterium]
MTAAVIILGPETISARLRSRISCGSAREAISASLDGEAVELGAGDLERHLFGCGACQAWRESAHRVTRRARLGPAAQPPAPSAMLIAAVLDVLDGAV